MGRSLFVCSVVSWLLVFLRPKKVWLSRSVFCYFLTEIFETPLHSREDLVTRVGLIVGLHCHFISTKICTFSGVFDWGVCTTTTEKKKKKIYSMTSFTRKLYSCHSSLLLYPWSLYGVLSSVPLVK